VVTEADKAKLLESLRRSRSGSEGKKITLTRRQTSEIRQADSSGRSRTIPVEVRKKRVFVKRDPAELMAEAAKSLSEEDVAAEQPPVAGPTAPAEQAAVPEQAVVAEESNAKAADGVASQDVKAADVEAEQAPAAPADKTADAVVQPEPEPETPVAEATQA